MPRKTKRRTSNKLMDSVQRQMIEKDNMKEQNNKIFIPSKVDGRTHNQRLYIEAIEKNQVVICDGPAGSGKTRLAIGMGIKSLRDGAVERVIITRPAVESANAKLGFLPGNIVEKLQPYLIGIFHEAEAFASKEEIEHWRQENKISILPFGYMRGVTFHNAFVIGEELQCATYDELKLFFTRIGLYSKIVVTCDATQSDLPIHLRGGIEKFIERLQGLEGIGVVKLNKADILRSPLITKILDRLENTQN